MNLKKLNEIIDKCGIKKLLIAEELGITDASLRNKLAGKTDFKWTEIQKLVVLLRLSPATCSEIFYIPFVAESATVGDRA
jgi:hypothetical protein